MIYLDAIILGIVQGLTEFLPVSSSGHLILLGKIGISLGEENIFFNLAMHIGTLLAVVLVFRKKIVEVVKKPFSPLTKNLVIATIPTVIIAMIFKYFCEDMLNGRFLALGFMMTTVLLTIGEMFKKTERKLNSKSAFIVGLVQGIAVLPGVSRSGSTVSAMNLLNINREESANFTFLLSIPIILGGFVMELTEINLVGVNWLAVLLGMACSFVSGILSIKIFLKLFKNSSIKYFAIYTFGLSIVSLFV